MILSDKDIKKYIAEGRIKINPSPNFEEQLGPCSLDLHLGNIFKTFKRSPYPFLDLKRKIDFEALMEETIIEDGSPFVLEPKGFVLAVTKEDFTLADDLMARLDGRSSLARLGVVVHLTAARFDPGWQGKAVMELGNLGPMPVILYAGITRICALTFELLSGPSQLPYLKYRSRKYANPTSPHASKLNQELQGDIKNH